MCSFFGDKLGQVDKGERCSACTCPPTWGESGRQYSRRGLFPPPFPIQPLLMGCGTDSRESSLSRMRNCWRLMSMRISEFSTCAVIQNTWCCSLMPSWKPERSMFPRLLSTLLLRKQERWWEGSEDRVITRFACFTFLSTENISHKAILIPSGTRCKE